MRGFCSCQVLGTLAEPVQVLTSKAGKPYSKLLIEVESSQKTASGEYEKTVTIFPVTLLGSFCNVAEKYLAKGDAVSLLCRVQGGEYFGSDGVKKYSISLLAESLHLLPNGRKTSSDSSQSRPEPKAAEPPRKAAKLKAPPRDYDRKPVMKEVARNEQNEPSDIPF